MRLRLQFPSSADSASALPFRPRILIVEDSVVLADMMCQALEVQAATSIRPASSVVGALSLVESTPIDASTLDVNLGSELSFPVCYRLLERRIPFLFLSGCDSAAMPAPLRATRFVRKPFDSPTLIAAVRALLPANTLFAGPP